MARTFGTTSIVFLVFVVIATVLFYSLVPPPPLPRVNLQISEETVVYVAVRLPVGKPYTDHAITKHGEEAVRAEQCGTAPELTLYNPETNRFADICKTTSGLFGVFIYQIEQGLKREVTALEKNKMESLKQVLQWLKNCKYGPKLPPGIPVQ